MMLQTISYEVNVGLANVRGEEAVAVLAADVPDGVQDNGSAAVVESVRGFGHGLPFPDCERQRIVEAGAVTIDSDQPGHLL